MSCMKILVERFYIMQLSVHPVYPKLNQHPV
eukprot:Gb_25322 [translate_table: standard]